MSEVSLILVLHLKTNKTLNDIAKIQIKSEKHTPFFLVIIYICTQSYNVCVCCYSQSVPMMF